MAREIYRVTAKPPLVSNSSHVREAPLVLQGKGQLVNSGHLLPFISGTLTIAAAVYAGEHDWFAGPPRAIEVFGRLVRYRTQLFSGCKPFLVAGVIRLIHSFEVLTDVSRRCRCGRGWNFFRPFARIAALHWHPCHHLCVLPSGIFGSPESR